MANDPRYLRICNWENYQIYHDGRPMKFFAVQAVDDEKRGRRGILTNPAFLRLADRSDCPVFQLMALAARDNNRIPNDAKYLQGVLACTNEPNISEMLDAGFLEVHPETLAQQSQRTGNGVSRTKNIVLPSIEKTERTERERPFNVEVPVAKPAKAESSTKRPTDELWDALVQEVGTQPATRTERGAWNKALKELREVKATPSEIFVRCRAYRLRYPGMSLTPNALVKHWGALADSSAGPSVEERRQRKYEHLHEETA